MNYLTLVFKVHQITLANFHTQLENIEKIDSNLSILFNHKGLDDSNFINDGIVTEIDRLYDSTLRSVGSSNEDFINLLTDVFSILGFWEYEYDLAKTLGDYALILEKETTK